MTAFIIADLLKSRPIYDQLLDRALLNRKDRKLSDIDKSANTVLEAVVCLGSRLEGELIRNITWPENCLLVNIKRGDKQIIPRGDTIILAGDYLNILTNRKQEQTIKSLLLQMAGHQQRPDMSEPV